MVLEIKIEMLLHILTLSVGVSGVAQKLLLQARGLGNTKKVMNNTLLCGISIRTCLLGV